MKMKIMYSLVVLACGLLTSSLANASSDCNGPWIPGPPGYRPGSGGICVQLGLNSRAGVCQPGQEFETLCDDSPQGYRICRGPRRCNEDRGDRGRDRDRGRGDGDFFGGGRHRDNDCRNWDFIYDRPCPRGYSNDDCRGGCEPN